MREQETTSADYADSEDEIALANNLAAFAKAFFMYPESNSRVQETRQSLLAGLELYLEELSSFSIDIRRDEVRVPSGRLEDRPLLTWLRESLERTAVSSVRMERGITAESLHLFLNRLRANMSDRSKVITFATRWPEAFPGIVLGESRYLGGFHDENVDESVDRGTVRQVLAGAAGSGGPGSGTGPRRYPIALNDKILEQIRHIESLLQKRGQIEGGDLTINLVDELVAALPTAAGVDSEASQQLIEEVLEGMLPALEGLVMGEKEDEATRIYAVVRELAGRFFRVHRRAKDVPKPAEDSKPTNRRRDAQITDDLDAMLEEFEDLPQGEIVLQPSESVAQAEALRTCLHELGRCRRENLAQLICAKVAAILEEPAPETLWVLDQYVDKLLAPGHNRLEMSRVRRVMDRFAANGLLPMLRDCQVVSPKMLIERFPAGFVLYVDCLDAESSDHHDALARVCAGVGDLRIRRAESTLAVDDGLLRADRAEKVLIEGRIEFLPVARILARHADADGALRALIASYLGSLELERRELLVVRVVQPLSKIPASFLADLCTLILDDEKDPNLCDYAGFLIRSFLDGLPEDVETVSRRAYAIVALGKFPSAETVESVRRQIRGRGLFGLIRPNKEIRDAATRVLARIAPK